VPFIEPRYASDEEAADEALLAMDWEIPWHAKILPFLLTAALVAAWVGYLISGLDFEAEGLAMMKWAVSSEALRDGRYQNLLLHMLAHGGPWHLLMNAAALVALGPPLVARLGPPLGGWLRFLAFFLASGLAGAALYLAIHPYGSVPMLGSSGAICGLLGLLARFQKDSDELIAIRSRKVWLAATAFVKDNAFLFVLLTVPALLSGRSGGVAWEAHLGGALFGLFAGPFFLAKSPEPHLHPTIPER
jgi:membrane associated rhomboid family serine protease